VFEHCDGCRIEVVRTLVDDGDIVVVKKQSEAKNGDMVAARQASKKKPRTYGDYREMLRRPDVDAVVFATIAAARDKLVIAALQAGKHVHLEKPPAARLADIQAVVALAREKKLLLQTGFMWRYNPGFLAIFEAARKGWLGDVFLVRGFISQPSRACATQGVGRVPRRLDVRSGIPFRGCHRAPDGQAQVRIAFHPSSRQVGGLAQRQQSGGA
jgi:predicted dehydrogenase